MAYCNKDASCIITLYLSETSHFLLTTLPWFIQYLALCSIDDYLISTDIKRSSAD